MGKCYGSIVALPYYGLFGHVHRAPGLSRRYAYLQLQGMTIGVGVGSASLIQLPTAPSEAPDYGEVKRRDRLPKYPIRRRLPRCFQQPNICLPAGEQVPILIMMSFIVPVVCIAVLMHPQIR